MTGSKILLPLLISVVFMMDTIDGTMLGTILPTVAADLGVNPVDIKLALGAYFLAMAALIPASSWVTDVIGPRIMFTAAIAMFTVGSVVCAVSDTLPMLVAARLLQGVGGAMMFPVGRLILVRSVEKKDIVRASSLLTIPSALALVLGPLLAGFVATYADWRVLFYINVPIGIIGMIMSVVLVPNFGDVERRPFDVIGFVLSSLGLASLGFGAMALSGGDLPIPISGGLTALGALLVALYVRHATRAKAPILDLSLFKYRTFYASAVGSFILRGAVVGALPFLLPLLLQVGMGLTPLESGSITVVGAVATLLMKFIIGPALKLAGFQTFVATTALVGGLSLAVLAMVVESAPTTIIMAILFVSALCTVMQIVAFESMIFAEVEQQQMSQASTMLSVIKQLSASAGVAVAALLVSGTLPGGIGQEAALLGVQASAGSHQLGNMDFRGAVFIVALVIAGTALIAWRKISQSDGAEIAGRAH